MTDYFILLNELLKKYVETIINHCELPSNGITPKNIEAINEELYYSILVDSFFRQLFRQIAQDLNSDPNRLPQISYSLSIAPPSPKSDSQQNKMNDMKSKLLVLLAQTIPQFEVDTLTTLCNYVFDIWGDEDAACLKQFNLSLLSKFVDETSTEMGDLGNGNMMFEIYTVEKSSLPFSVYRYFSILTYLLMEKGLLSFYCSPYSLSKSHKNNISKGSTGKTSIMGNGTTSESKQYNVYTFDLTGEKKTGYAIDYDKKYLSPSYNALDAYPLELEIRTVCFDRSAQEQEDKMLISNSTDDQNLIENTIFLLGRRINLMIPEVCTFIKNNIDLSKPNDTHLLKDIFGIPDDSEKLALGLWYQKLASDFNYIYDLHNIRRLKFTRITTERIETLLILPWIRHFLTPAIVDVCATGRRANKIPDSEECCLLFSDEIIETKNKGLSPKTLGSSITCAAFLLDVFNESLENAFAAHTNGPIPHCIVYDKSPKNGRHFNIVLNSILLDNMNIDVKRIAKRTYAVQFTRHNVIKTIVPQNQQNDKPTSVKVISAENIFKMYPLIRKYQVISNSTHGVSDSFFVENECFLAAGKNDSFTLVNL